MSVRSARARYNVASAATSSGGVRAGGRVGARHPVIIQDQALCLREFIEGFTVEPAFSRPVRKGFQRRGQRSILFLYKLLKEPALRRDYYGQQDASREHCAEKEKLTL